MTLTFDLAIWICRWLLWGRFIFRSS